MSKAVLIAFWSIAMASFVGCKERSGGEAAPGASARQRDLSVPLDGSMGLMPGDKAPTAYSMIELIARPERYFGTRTVISGFLVLEKEHEFLGGEDGLLYLGREDSVMLLNNWVRVKFGECRFNRTKEKLLTYADVEGASNSYVTIRGIFEPPPEGAPHPFGGTICGITSARAIEDPSRTDASAKAPESNSATASGVSKRP